MLKHFLPKLLYLAAAGFLGVVFGTPLACVQSHEQGAAAMSSSPPRSRSPKTLESPIKFKFALNPAAPQRPLLVWQEHPESEALINWMVEDFKSQAGHKVYYSKAPFAASAADLGQAGITEVSAVETGMASFCGQDGVGNLQAKLEALAGNTTYYFRLVSNGQVAPLLSFVTAPDSQRAPLKLLAGGDSRSDRRQRRFMNGEIRTLVTQEPAYLALVHGGDFVARGQSCQDWYQWREDHQGVITAQGRILPVIATFGNHEIGGEALFQAQFGRPQAGQPFYFHTTLGMIELLTLNSEISVEGQQWQWLQDKLRVLAHKSSTRFLIANYHRPAWPAVKSPARTTTWLPTFEAARVDLVLESDGHVLKQTCPIRAGACNAQDGTIYVGEGGLGVAQRQAGLAGAWYFAGGYAYGQHKIQSLSVDPGLTPADATLIYEVYFNAQFHHRLELPVRNRS